MLVVVTFVTMTMATMLLADRACRSNYGDEKCDDDDGDDGAPYAALTATATAITSASTH